MSRHSHLGRTIIITITGNASTSPRLHRAAALDTAEIITLPREKVVRPPSGPLWVHEIKHDGYRLMVRCEELAPFWKMVALTAVPNVGEHGGRSTVSP